MTGRARSLLVDALLLGLILAGGAGAAAHAGTSQPIFALLSQSTSTADPGGQITYSLEFHNQGNTTIQVDPLIYTWQAPAHTHKVSGNADFGASVPPMAVSTYTLTVQVDADAPQGASLTMAVYPTVSQESMEVDNDPQVASVTHATVGTPSSIGITAPASVTWPTKATVGGQVNTDFASYAGQPANLFTADQNTSRRAAVVTAGPGGSLTRQLQLTRQTSVWWTAGSATSASRTVTVKPALNATRSAASVGHGGTITVSGHTTPVRAGAAITLQRLSGGVWSTVQSAKAASASTSTTLGSGTPYSFAVTMPKGSYTFRVRVPADAGRLEATTPGLGMTFG